MKITIESTTRLVNAEPKQKTIQYRVWEGVTERGVKIQVLIPSIAVLPGEDVSQFEAELKQQPAPEPAVEVFPLRMII